jgi:hypoxia up-regulated 1
MRRTIAKHQLFGFEHEDHVSFGEAAADLLVRQPEAVFPHVKQLLGVKYSDPLILQYKVDFPHLTLVENARGTVSFQLENGDKVSVESIVAQLFQQIKSMAEKHASAHHPNKRNFTIDQVVLPVPEWFTADQRELLSQLASQAGLQTRASLHDLTAVAVDYAVRNAKAEKETLAFLGVGSYGVQASLIEVSKKDDGFYVKVLNKASERYLGGYAYDTVLRDSFRVDFDAKNDAHLTASSRAMGRLLAATRKLREQLSTETTASFTIDDLFQGHPLAVGMTRAEFDKQTAPLLSRVADPLKLVLAGYPDVKNVQLFGAASRTPSIVEHLRKELPKLTFSHSVDADEAAVLGAAHYATALERVPGVTYVFVDETPVYGVASEPSVALSKEGVALLEKELKDIARKVEERKGVELSRHSLESFLSHAGDELKHGVKLVGDIVHLNLENAILNARNFIASASRSTTAEKFEEVHRRVHTAVNELKAALHPKKPAVNVHEEL